MTITRGKVHKFLGMTIDYSSPVKLILSMIDYIGKILDDISEEIKGESSTPAVHHLFEIAEDETKIYQAGTDIFHQFLAQLLYLSKRARPEIHIAVSFLYTRLRGTDTNDYKNLERVMKYIQGTIDLTLVFSIDKSGNIKWYVDASFSVHKDIRSHTGGFMTIGTGGAYMKPSKHKLNTKSSNEAKIFGVDYVMTQVICTLYFLNEQGYMIHNNVKYQDKQSAKKL